MIPDFSRHPSGHRNISLLHVNRNLIRKSENQKISAQNRIIFGFKFTYEKEGKKRGKKREHVKSVDEKQNLQMKGKQANIHKESFFSSRIDFAYSY